MCRAEWNFQGEQRYLFESLWMSLRHSLLGFPRFIFVGEYKISGNNYDDDDKKKLIRQTIAFQRSYVVSVIRFSRLEIIVAIKKLSRNY